MTTTLERQRPATALVSESANPKRWWILAVLGIAQLMIVLDVTIVNIALPTAQVALGFSDNARQWIVTAYALAFGSLLLIGGRIADIVGRKRVFIVGLVGFAIASAIGGAAADVGMLIAARAVQGLFAALLAPTILAILTTTFTSPTERGKAFGVFGAIAGAGATIGLLLGGFLTEYASWRWTMFVNLFFAVAALVGGLALLEHRRAAERPTLDVPGTVTVSAGLFALVYGFSRADTDGWSDGVTIATLFAAGVLLIAFALIQFRATHPLLPPRIVLDRNRGGAYLAMFLSAAGMFAVFLFLTYYLQLSKGYSAVMTGIAFMPMTAMVVLTTTTVSTTLVQRITSKILVPTGMATAAFAMFLLTRIGLDTGYSSHVLPAVLLLGLGMGLVFAPGFSLATLGVRLSDSGVASATTNTMQQVGGSVGTALLNTLAASAATVYGASHAAMATSPGNVQLLQANAAVHSYTTAFSWAAAILGIGAVVCAIVLRPGLPDFGHATEGAVAI